MTKLKIDKQALMELDIDGRIAYIWKSIDEAAQSGKLSDLEFIGSIVRAAYGQGYVDALREPHGKLQADNGYTPPPRFDENAK